MSQRTIEERNYLDMIERIAKIYRDPSRDKILENYSRISYRITSYLASMEGLLYQKMGQKINAEQSRRYLIILSSDDGLPVESSGGPIGEFGLYAAAFAYDCIKDSGVLSDEDQQIIRERLIQSALGAAKSQCFAPFPRIDNHKTLGMAGSRMVAHLFPEREESRLLRFYAGEIWNDWWAIRDNPEVSSCYEPFTQASLIQVAELEGIENQYFSDPIIKATFERYLQHLSPLGVMTQYGDSGWGDSWGLWAAVFEKAASYYSNGHFKWAARRILEYAYNQKFWNNAYNSEKKCDFPLATRHILDAEVLIDAYGLVLAALWSNDEIQEQVPDYPSSVTHRYLPSNGPPFTTGERAEEKLVLRSGWEKDDVFMMVSLLRKMRHDQYDAGAILLLSCKDSVLLKDQGYNGWREPRFHNGLLVRAEEEEFLSPQKILSSESFATVKFLSEHSRVCFANIRSSEHQGYPVEHTRTIIFGKESHIVGIWDVARIDDSRYQVGPLYHTQKIVSQGRSYFDTTQEFMMSSDGDYWVNNAYNLLISFPLQTGQVRTGTPQLPLGAWDATYEYEPSWIPIYAQARTTHECLYQIALGSKGERKSFLSLLIPHSPGEDVANIIKSIHILSSNEVSCCIKVGSVTLVFNDGPHLSNDFITTDGRLVYIEQKDEKKYIAFYGTKNIILEGKRIFSKAKKSDGEIIL